MPENPSASAFGTEVIWTAGVILAAGLVVAGTRAGVRKVIALKNRNK